MIYFLQREDTAIKIGIAAHFPSRLAQLEHQHGTLVQLGFLPGGEPEETRLHHLFAEYALGYEWFQSATPLLTYIIASSRPEPITHSRVLLHLWLEKERRDGTRYNERDIARGCELPPILISRLLNGYDFWQLQLKNVIKLCGWFGCDLQEFAGRVRCS